MNGEVIFYRDTEGKFRWSLKASNGRIIADSGQGYTTKRACKKGFESVLQHTFMPDRKFRW